MKDTNAASSDVRMVLATQVAYLDGDKGMTVEELVNRTLANYDGRPDLSGAQQKQLDYAKHVREMIEEYGLEDCKQWVLKEVANDNSRTGFYGCLIDTQDGEAIIGFRGSESFDSNQSMKDWAVADFGMLNNPETKQQKQAAEFTQFVQKKYGGAYEAFSFSGHSLGGNLAEHAAVTAPEGMPIRRALNLDGPGFSDEYILLHSAQIRRNSQYVDHYQYSLVGTVLHPLLGSHYRTIEATNGGEGFGGYLTRHATENIVFDPETGMARDGKRDPVAQATGPLTRVLEDGGLWVVAPNLAFLWTMANQGFTMFAGLQEQIGQAAEAIHETLRSLKEVTANWFRGMFGAALLGEYEMRVGAVSSLGGRMDSAAAKLARIGGELSDLARELQYQSLSGSYFKSKLRSAGYSIVREGDKASALAEAARICARQASSDDDRVSQCFGGS